MATTQAQAHHYTPRDLEEICASIEQAETELRALKEQAEQDEKADGHDVGAKVRATAKAVGGKTTRVFYETMIEVLLDVCRELILATGIFAAVLEHLALLGVIPAVFVLLLGAKFVLGKLGED